MHQGHRAPCFDRYEEEGKLLASDRSIRVTPPVSVCTPTHVHTPVEAPEELEWAPAAPIRPRRDTDGIYAAHVGRRRRGRGRGEVGGANKDGRPRCLSLSCYFVIYSNPKWMNILKTKRLKDEV